ncbi:MAG: SIMPL domain-containing protein [Planctomycetes bacterium]|nr:SIMPL domain-containing protein [Planctomycetota bacterium]
MLRPLFRITLLCSLGLFLPLSIASGQLGGSRAGVEGGSLGVPDLAPLDRDVVQSHIAIEGRAEIRVRPTEIRIVLAVTGEGDDAQSCRRSVGAIVQQLKQAWVESGIEPRNIVEDFIAILPRYEWQLEKQGNTEVGVERKVGYRMQTNLHLAIPDDSAAQKALDLAFAQGITDIIGFDYWNGELDASKVKAREQAVQAALGKAELLLGTLFDDRPPVINVQEQTTVRYPESLYQSFTRAYDEDVTPSWRRDVPFIRAPRPQNTYYRGLYTDSDVQPGELPMRPEISVVSTVRIYYRTPAADEQTMQEPAR